MKRLVLIAGGVLAAGVAGWSVLWFTGQGAIERRVDEEIARLGQQGYQVVHGETEIGGFPLGYEVTYRDVVVTDTASGIRYELPSMTGIGDVTAPGTVRFVFPPEFRVMVPLDEGIRSEYEVLPEELAVDVEAEGLFVDVAQPGANAIEVAAEAQSLLIVAAAGEAGEFGAAFELGAMEGDLTVPSDPEVGTVRGRGRLARLDYAVSLLNAQGARTTVEGYNDAMSASLSSSLRTPEQLQRLLSTGQTDGSAELVYETGPAVSQIKIEGTGPGVDGTVEQSAGTGGGVVSVGDGRVAIRVSSQNNVYRMLPDAADQPLRGEVELDSLDLVYDAPIVIDGPLEPFTMRLALSGLDIAESLWNLIDPTGTLDRETAHMVAEVTGTGRLTAPEIPDEIEIPLEDLEQGLAPMIEQPGTDIELGSLKIVTLSLDALGADVVANGEMEFIQPLNIPEGQVTVRMRNALDTVGKLAALGLIDEGTYQAAALMSSIYTRPGAAEGELVSEIEMSLDGVLVNGLPVR